MRADAKGLGATSQRRLQNRKNMNKDINILIKSTFLIYLENILNGRIDEKCYGTREKETHLKKVTCIL